MIIKKKKTDLQASELFDLEGGECTCMCYNIETDEEYKSDVCLGDCSAQNVENFVAECGRYFRPGKRIRLFPVWNGFQTVCWDFKTIKDIIWQVPPRHGMYELKWGLVKEPGRGNKRVWIAIWLKHHDGERMYFF
jgi:hypothetical protein